MYTVDDIKVLKGLDALRRRPEMYMPEGVSGAGISARLATDALLLGAGHVRTDVVGIWNVVSADLDWLTKPVRVVVALPELFQRLVVFDEGGPNAARSEAWVGAYCAVAYVAARNERLRVVGEKTMPLAVEKALLPQGCVRSVAFLVKSS